MTQQKLNDNQREDKIAESNKTPNKHQLILPNSIKQDVKLKAKMRNHIRTNLIEDIPVIKDNSYKK